MLAIELPEDIELRLDGFAREAGQTLNDYVREALIEYVTDREDLRAAEETVLAIRSGEDKPVPLEDMMKRYGLAD
jgi:RHH-type rel operon transcriptional repressor/antitoxin RelB